MRNRPESAREQRRRRCQDRGQRRICRPIDGAAASTGVKIGDSCRKSPIGNVLEKTAASARAQTTPPRKDVAVAFGGAENNVEDGATCPRCKDADEDMFHLFNCPAAPTDLSPIDLWLYLTRVASFLARHPSFFNLPPPPPEPPPLSPIFAPLSIPSSFFSCFSSLSIASEREP